jgi:hypothetical protein
VLTAEQVRDIVQEEITKWWEQRSRNALKIRADCYPFSRLQSRKLTAEESGIERSLRPE